MSNMELMHEGQKYQLLTIHETLSRDHLSNEDDLFRYIVDCRSTKPDDIINTSATFSLLVQHIQEPKVSYIWLNCCTPKFLEIKERLRKRLMDVWQDSDVNPMLVKLTTHKPSTEDIEALKTSDEVVKFNKSLSDMPRLLDAHPGILHGKLTKKSRAKRKRDNEDTQKSVSAYNDKRRPARRVFTNLKKMQKVSSKGNEKAKNKPCYMCKIKNTVEDICNGCLVLNYTMRQVSCDLKGRYAIVTGGRIKIGFETSLRLLRDGCYVIVTTRFPVNAAKRFSSLTDFDAWKQRLKICQLDLQDMTSIEQFLSFVKKTIPHLDILINNAAQTIYRPQQYYQSLITNELNDLPTLTNDACNVLVDKPQSHLGQSVCSSNKLDYGSNHGSNTTDHGSNTTDHGSNTTYHGSNTTDHGSNSLDHVFITPSHMFNTTYHGSSATDHMSNTSEHISNTPEHMSNTSDHMSNTSDHMPNTPDHMSNTLEHMSNASDHMCNTPDYPLTKEYYTQTHSMLQCPESTFPNIIAVDEFPLDEKDEHGEQLDLRLRNSWTYNLNEVPLQELLQVLTINAIGPFILTARLKPLLKQSPFRRKFVVNVSAMEGQFSRVSKGHRHPHTNMAKAALNMMTRTSGLEYQMDGIYMTAVDTGWVTDERPFQQAMHESVTKGFKPPLDCHDGAARVYHPIYHGLNPQNTPHFAVFLKDFRPFNW